MTSTEIDIQYVNGFCGAGKTYAIAKYAKEQCARGRKVLIVQPTTRLIEQTTNKTFTDLDVVAGSYRAIHGDNADAPVKQITEYLKTCAPGGEILLITHSAFFSIPHFENKHDWIVVIDEIPQVDVSHEMNIPDSHHLLTSHISVVDTSRTQYHRISEKIGSSSLSQFSKNRNGDVVYAQFSKFAGHVLSSSWEVYVDAASYYTLTNEVDVAGINRKLIAYGIMSPIALSGFAAVIITAACFTESVMYMLWRRWADTKIVVDFVDITDEFSLRYQKHANGHLVDIYFAIAKSWSKNIRESEVEIADGSYAILGDAIISKARSLFGSEPSAFFANADITGSPFENSERLPNTTHGLNSFQGIDHICAVAAFNPSPQQFKFLSEFTAATSEEITTAMTRQGTYQAICQTSIRDITSTKKKKWVVTDLNTAQWLQMMFDGARIHDLGLFAKKIISGRRPKKLGLGVEEKYNDLRHRQDEIRIRLARLAIATGGKMTTKIAKAADVAASSMQTEIDNIALSPIVIRNEFQGTFFCDRVSTIGIPQLSSFDDLIEIFRAYAEETFPSKDASPAFSPAHYVVNDCGTARGAGNIAYARNIILDVDSGGMTPEFFAAIFPTLKMMIHSSWSHSAVAPKYRIVIATSSPVDFTGYSVITSHILDTLRDRGYFSAHEVEAKPGIATRKTFKGVHGIDRTKLTPACILFVPSQGANPNDRFFHVFDHDRAPLDVATFLEAAAVAPKPAPAPSAAPSSSASPSLMALRQVLTTAAPSPSSSAARIAAALSAWNAADRPGYRDTGFFILASSLSRAGCDRFELAQHLEHAVSTSTAQGKSRKDLRNKKTAMLRKFG